MFGERENSLAYSPGSTVKFTGTTLTKMYKNISYYMTKQIEHQIINIVKVVIKSKITIVKGVYATLNTIPNV